MKNRWVLLILLAVVVAFSSGCMTLEKAKSADKLSYDLSALRKKMEKLKSEKDAEIERLKLAKGDEVRSKELSDLERAKLELEKKLQDEIEAYKTKLKITERGLVVTFLSEIFFDSGKDKIRAEGEATLRKVAEVLSKNVPDADVAVEGHTDNDPIRHSGWKSNWELSSARALAVIHYFIDQCSIAPTRLSASGYGEYRPVGPNDTIESRRQNRRVEIVIFPLLRKVKNSADF